MKYEKPEMHQVDKLCDPNRWFMISKNDMKRLVGGGPYPFHRDMKVRRRSEVQK